ncbi:hypothetical protein PVL29_015100 [Vitis rotundifolia]|uniref:RNA polymerase Rpb4/RPC9 core domain-containing protein n=1 Tax=Vitis rotundifolia TaxID=103349 RepID=A0AA38ZBP7_VITRO|nr:hypothetical protein PVL29_015100 [Vitis rotundifolia]
MLIYVLFTITCYLCIYLFGDFFFFFAEFLKAKCLMNCEVAVILEHKYEQLQQMSDDPLNQVSQVFEKSLQYVKRFSRYKNPDAVRQVREILSRYQLAEFELCVLGNLCPETVEEAIAMVPSIKVNLFGLNMWLSTCVYLIFAGLKIC